MATNGNDSTIFDPFFDTVRGRPSYPGQAATDYFDVRRLANEEEERRRKSLAEQREIQSTRLKELTALLAQEENRKFNQAIPEIAESAQAQGFLETSGFGNALARERARLAGDTAFRLGEQALTDRDFEVSSLSDISRGTGELNIGALERKFSVMDLGRSEALSRELAKLGVVNPQRSDKSAEFSNYAQGAAALAGAAKGTYICTHLKSLGLMTEEEVNQVHDKIFPYAYFKPFDLLAYALYAPQFIVNNPNLNWSEIKVRFSDDILKCSTSEEAFDLYKNNCIELFGLTANQLIKGY